jgi:transcriptional regulator with XRE-family HTH domain
VARKPDPTAFNGPALSALCERAGLTTAQLAERAGIHRTYLYAILRGEKKPGWDVICKLADALGCSLDAFRA